MNQMMITQELISLASVLGRLVIAQNSQTVRDVEITLSMAERFPKYFQMLLQILQRKEFTQDIRKLASVMINNFVQDHLDEDSEDLGKHSRQLLDSLKDSSIDFSLKSNIAVALAKIIKKDEQKHNFQSLLSTLKSCLTSSSDCLNLDLCIFLGRAIIQSEMLTSAQLSPLLDRFIEFALTIKQCLRIKIETYDFSSICKMSERMNELIQLIITFFKITKKDDLNLQQRLITMIKIIPISQHGRILFTKDLNQNNKIHESLSYIKSVGYDLMSILLERCTNSSSGNIGDFNRKVKSIVQEIMSGLTGMFIYDSQYSPGIRMKHVLQSQLNFICHLYASPVLSQFLKEYQFTILKVISQILEFTHKQITNFINQPINFTNLIVEIIEPKNQQIEKQEEVQPFSQGCCLKVKAAQLLVQICKERPALSTMIIDQLVATIVDFIKLGKICINPMLMLNILNKYINANQIANIGMALQFSLSIIPPNMFNNSQLICVQYAFYLITLSTFVKVIPNHQVVTLRNILTLASELTSDSSYFEVYQIIGCELIESLFERHEQHHWIIEETLRTLNKKLEQKMQERKVTTYLLDSIFHFVQNGEFKFEHRQILEQTLKVVGKCIELELSYISFQQFLINKCWNIIRRLSQDTFVLTHLMGCLQQTITPLVEYFTMTKKGDFEEDCFLLMSTIIQHEQKVSNFVLEIYRLIPMVFYKQYDGRFGHCFQALQLMICYGQQIIINRNEMMQEIIQMCLHSLRLESEADSCEGVLILHSLIMKVGKNINGNTYLSIFAEIIKKLSKKLHNKELKIALVSLMGLCIAYSQSEWITPDQLTITFKKMNEVKSCKDVYFLRVIFMSTCEVALKLPLRMMDHYIGACIELFKISERLLQKKLEKKIHTQIKVLKDNVTNMATNLKVKEYLLQFIRKFKKTHKKHAEAVMDQTGWRWILDELQQAENNSFMCE